MIAWIDLCTITFLIRVRRVLNIKMVLDSCWVQMNMNIGRCVCNNPVSLFSWWISVLFHSKQVPSEYIRVNHWHLHCQHREWRQNTVKILHSILPASPDQQHRAGIHIGSVPVLDFSCSGLWEGHESTSVGITCRRVMLFCVFVLCRIFCLLTELHDRLSDSDSTSPTWDKFSPCFNIPPFSLYFLMPCTAFQLLTHTKRGFLWVQCPLRYS